MRQARETTADLVIAMVGHVTTRFERYGYVLPAAEALQSHEVTGSLLKMAVFSMNMHTMRIPGQSPGEAEPILIPDFLIAAGMHYAMMVSPFTGNRGQDETIAHVDDLLEHIERIEATHGEISIDRGLVDLICTRLDIAIEPEGTAPAPEGTQR